uniref:Uncharacterized protein LOC111112950 n=1 Tax=Crassostrea virginica TaxID=6565 RepID=A0A8B8BUH2_CRAVI|nr:uncharacterized protein LOC111112950 [Crassostrea virginica]
MSNTADRRRQLTEKGQTMFEEQCEKLKGAMDKKWKEVEDVLIDSGSCGRDFKKVREVERDLNLKFKDFCVVSGDYKKFLERKNTDESHKLLKECDRFMNQCFSIVKKTSEELKATKFELLENLSHVSSSSSLKRAIAETEKAKLLLIKREGELLKQKTEIDVNLNIVRQEQKIANVEAEADSSEDEVGEDANLPTETVNREQFTSDFVLHNTNPPEAATHQSVNWNNPMGSFMPPPVSHTPYAGHYIPPVSNNLPPPPVSHNPHAAHYLPPLNDNSPPVAQIPQGYNTCPSAITDFSKFLLRKDFLLTRFSNFDDRPETFSAWSASFRSIVQELGVTPFEEMDLLVKWLGPESSKFARTLRSANTHNPTLGVTRIWDRLHDRYGRPEMIESALKGKLDSFPNLTNKDSSKLYDLVDILTEIESAMSNPKCALLLSYFNSSTGVLPILSKLPTSIQDKWATQASGYKKRHCVPYPTFSFFVNFIREMCEIRNDPGLTCAVPVNTKNKPRFQSASTVTARKLEVSSTQKSDNERCPIHNTGHSLNECRGFRKKSLQDRQKFLRERKICFRCCSSQSHIAQDCSVNVKCEICGNSRHATVMHLDRRPQKSGSQSIHSERTSEDHGGEASQHNSGSVGTLCTKLCGNLISGRSCGKIILVDVFPTANPENQKRVYAVVDDQSNRSLISTTLLDQLAISGECEPYTLSSCSGVSTQYGRRVNGLCVKSFDGSDTLNLPELIECNSIPSSRHEIPTPDVAQAYPHLCHIASSIPPLDHEAKIELLIGRDIPQVHHVLDQVIGDKGQPFAQRLLFGWVIIGEVCIGQVHAPREVNVRKTQILNDGRCTTFPLCPYNISVKRTEDELFVRTPDDNKVGLSVEDKQFL